MPHVKGGLITVALVVLTACAPASSTPPAATPPASSTPPAAKAPATAQPTIAATAASQDQPKPAPTSPPAAAAQSTTPPQDATPIRVEHHGGVTAVPRNPQRIVAMLGEEDLHTLLALGVVPVLSATWSWETNPFADRIQPVPEKLPHPLDLEVVARARPDLIVGTDAEIKTYEQLSGIAPTILIDRYGSTPDDHLRLLGRALQRETDAERGVNEYRARVSAVRGQVEKSRLGSVPYAVAFKWVSQGQLRIFGQPSFAGRMLLETGASGLIDPGRATPESTGRFGDSFSVERLNALESAKALVLIVHPQVPAGEAISDLPNWHLLPIASNADAVFEVKRELWYIETALTRMGRLDDIERIAQRLG
jgi:iron complex transport system substrate-binding protein